MWGAATVLVCALDLLGRSAGSFPPIAFLEVRPPDVSARADAFVRRDDDTIYLVTTAPAFQRLQRSRDRCGDLNSVRSLASVLVHEEWHVRNGPDERRAYEAQLMALRAMNAGPGNPVYAAVNRAMTHTLKALPRQVLASR
jgi:hypothetical protein